MFKLMLVTGILAAATLAGCSPDQAQPSQKPSDGLGVATQPAPWVDPACFVEGALVALECNEGAVYPSCPSEDSPAQQGEPCFWTDPNGLGLLWSDGKP